MESKNPPSRAGLSVRIDEIDEATACVHVGPRMTRETHPILVLIVDHCSRPGWSQVERDALRITDDGDEVPCLVSDRLRSRIETAIAHHLIVDIDAEDFSHEISRGGGSL